jgi:hypothetical protein
MALSASRISAMAGNGLAAAATARPMSGGRGVASAAMSPVETSEFSSNIGVNDNAILHYDEEGGLDSDGRRRESPSSASPFLARGAFGYQVEDLSQDGTTGDGGTFLSDVLYGVGIYESNLRAVAPGQVRPGATLNQLH